MKTINNNTIQKSDYDKIKDFIENLDKFKSKNGEKSNNNEKSKINDDINNSRDLYNKDKWHDKFTIDSKKMVTEPEIPKLKLPTQYEVVITLSQTDDGKTNIEKLSSHLVTLLETIFFFLLLSNSNVKNLD